MPTARKITAGVERQDADKKWVQMGTASIDKTLCFRSPKKVAACTPPLPSTAPVLPRSASVLTSGGWTCSGLRRGRMNAREAAFVFADELGLKGGRCRHVAATAGEVCSRHGSKNPARKAQIGFLWNRWVLGQSPNAKKSAGVMQYLPWHDDYGDGELPNGARL